MCALKTHLPSVLGLRLSVNEWKKNHQEGNHPDVDKCFKIVVDEKQQDKVRLCRVRFRTVPAWGHGLSGHFSDAVRGATGQLSVCD